MDMIEQFKMARFMLGLMAGTSNVDSLREKVIAEAMGRNAVPYAELKPDDKKECDEAVEGMSQLAGIFDDVIVAKATLTKRFFDALQKQGFTAAEALAITAAQPIEAKVAT